MQVLVNHGREAGASIAHPHAQLLALDLVPPAVRVAAERFAAAPADPVIADLELAAQRGLVVVDERPIGAPAWCPWAGSSAYVVRIARARRRTRASTKPPTNRLPPSPARCGPSSPRSTPTLDEPAYNVVVHSMGAGHERYHWYVEVIPRIAFLAGFEIGTGLFVNTVPPDTAADRLRAAAT